MHTSVFYLLHIYSFIDLFPHLFLINIYTNAKSTDLEQCNNQAKN